MVVVYTSYFFTLSFEQYLIQWMILADVIHCGPCVSVKQARKTSAVRPERRGRR
jgi:hypothetical protein